MLALLVLLLLRTTGTGGTLQRVKTLEKKIIIKILKQQHSYGAAIHNRID